MSTTSEIHATDGCHTVVQREACEVLWHSGPDPSFTHTTLPLADALQGSTRTLAMPSHKPSRGEVLSTVEGACSLRRRKLLPDLPEATEGDTRAPHRSLVAQGAAMLHLRTTALPASAGSGLAKSARSLRESSRLCTRFSTRRLALPS